VLAIAGITTLAAAAPLALVDATVHTVSGSVFDPGVVLVDGEKITAVGDGLSIPPGADVVSLAGLHLYPSVIDAYTVLGLVEIGSVRGSVDLTEVGSWNPNVRTESSINPDSELLPVTRAGGVLVAGVFPNGGILMGRSALIRLDGWTWEEMTVVSPLGMHLRWPSMRIDRRPTAKVKLEEQQRAVDEKIEQIREAFARARAYRRAMEATAKPGGPVHERDPRYDAMIPVLERAVPLIVHAGDRREIQAALDFAREESLRVVLVGGEELAEVADRLARERVPVICTSTTNLPARRWAAYDNVYSLPARLAKAGVLFCQSSGGEATNVRNLLFKTGMTVAYGLEPERALRTITLDAARVLGVADRYGSIEPGREATLIATDGDLLEATTNVMRAWIAGREVSLESRHTRLYQRYKNRPRG
jgi:imidazolonepropionase-like amidohydrolase